MGAPKNGGMRLLFDRHLMLEFRGAKITTDAGLLAVRELDEMMGLTDMAADLIEDKRTGKNLESVKDEGMKNDKSTCGTTVSRQREITRPGGDMERSVGEHATESTQPCRKGAIRGNITALEAAYEECEMSSIRLTNLIFPNSNHRRHHYI